MLTAGWIKTGSTVWSTVQTSQVIIITLMWPEILSKIQKAHQGRDNSIQRAQKSLCWPGMQVEFR